MRRLPHIGVLCVLLLCSFTRSGAQQRICYFGDSIAEGWIDAERHPDAAWPALLDSMLAGSGVTSYRVAHGGESSSDALRRIDRDVLRRTPDAVIVAFGSNDMYIWDQPPAPRVPLPSWRSQLRLIVRKLQGAGARVLLLGMPPMMETRFYGFADQVLYEAYGGAEALQSAYENEMRLVASLEQAAYVSLAPVFAGHEEYLGVDGVHPTREGHRMIARALSPHVAALLQKAKREFVGEDVQVFPSPFDTRRTALATIRFRAPIGSRAEISIVDLAGRLIRKIVYSAQTDGMHFLAWDGRSADGTRASSGAYTVYVRYTGTVALHRILLM